jgi:hypothetical protein
MGNFGSFIAIALTGILVPLIVGRIPYLNRKDVAARQAAKAQLPGWVSLIEFSLLAISVAVLTYSFFRIENYTHQVFHHGQNLLGTIELGFSFDSFFFLILALAPVIMALPLSMLLANFISWQIRPIRNIEDKIMSEGVPGYTWHDLNFRLIKASLISAPVCIIIALVSVIRL